jgi:3',5'-cyclic AMP phosphodiesterase CpdA
MNPVWRRLELTRTTTLRYWTAGQLVLFGVLQAMVSLGAEPFLFVQLSDPQFGMFADNTNFARETIHFERAVADVNRLRPAFVVITGDLVNKPGDAQQIAEYRRIAAQIDPSIRVYAVAGNHDVENKPTPASVAAYTNRFGPDYYSFRQGDFVGIVLNSTVIQVPDRVISQRKAQEEWLRAELARAQGDGAAHIVIFQHHSWFLKTPDEPDDYFNIPRAERARYLGWFRESGVRYLFSGHYHRNALARDGNLEAITTGPVGKPLGKEDSGMRVVLVTPEGLRHAYYELGKVPGREELLRQLQR